ncbi:hypothetical protein C8R45DRAFT_1079435, partial [Mycena sanguinolenta]
MNPPQRSESKEFKEFVHWDKPFCLFSEAPCEERSGDAMNEPSQPTSTLNSSALTGRHQLENAMFYQWSSAVNTSDEEVPTQPPSLVPTPEPKETRKRKAYPEVNPNPGCSGPKRRRLQPEASGSRPVAPSVSTEELLDVFSEIAIETESILRMIGSLQLPAKYKVRSAASGSLSRIAEEISTHISRGQNTPPDSEPTEISFSQELSDFLSVFEGDEIPVSVPIDPDASDSTSRTSLSKELSNFLSTFQRESVPPTIDPIGSEVPRTYELHSSQSASNIGRTPV